MQKKVRLATTVDPDVMAALAAEASRKRLTISALLNSILAERMAEELKKKGARERDSLAQTG